MDVDRIHYQLIFLSWLPENLVLSILKNEKERHKSLYFVFLFILDFLLKLFLGIIPTLIYKIRTK